MTKTTRRRTSSNKGKYYMPHPIDFALLKRLPPEGSRLGYHNLAATVERLTEELNKDIEDEDGRLRTTEVSGRMVAMKVAGYVTKVVLIGERGRHGWQRTKKGELHYAEVTGESLDNDRGLRAIEGGSK